MNTIATDSSGVQAAIHRVALSVDALLLNGIPYGVIHQGVFKGFLAKTADNLLTELASLEQEAPHAPNAGQGNVETILASLRVKCQNLVELVTRLESFKTLPLEELRSCVSQVALLREQCLQLIQQLEVCLEIPKLFSEARSSHSASMDNFLANLERVFEEARAGTNAG